MISKLQKFTESVTLDVLGVVIVVSASIAMGYHLTVIDGIPIGILSTVGAAFSMMATRLVTKRNNWGNLIGVLTTSRLADLSGVLLWQHRILLVLAQKRQPNAAQI